MEPDEFKDDPEQGEGVDGAKQYPTRRAFECEQREWGIRPGNQRINHRMIDSSEEGDHIRRGDDAMVQARRQIEEDEANAKQDRSHDGKRLPEQ